MIRPATSDDIESIRAIELAAGEAFRDIGMPEIADAELPSNELLQGFIDDGCAWVAVSEGAPAGFLLLDIVDEAAHIAQVSVVPAVRGRRIGAALIDHAEQWARTRRLRSLTLTTFLDVPWNAPYYERLGFTVVADDAITPGLREVLAEEAKTLDMSRRACMARRVS